MKLIIDLVLLAIIILCTWGGYKRGLIGGIVSLFIIMISLLGGTMVSRAYSGEVIPALKPFVSGYIDSMNSKEKILEIMDYNGGDYSLDDILTSDPTLKVDYAAACYQYIGFYEKTADKLAETTVDYAQENDVDMTNAVVQVMCETIAYVLGLTLAFLMILILLVAIGNLFNISMRIPNMENLDEIGGTVLGFLKGFFYCVLLCWFLSFLGAVIGKTTLYNTILGRFFIAFEFITGGLL